jgi:pyrroline-5-carboxylate reductase
MQSKKIAIIGAGNLGLSIAKGLVQSELIDKKNLILTEKSASRIQALQTEGYRVTEDNVEAISEADLIMLVVKPWQIDGLLTEIASTVDVNRHVLVSCVTGVTSNHIFNLLGKQVPLFRVMPNTGVAVEESMSCIASHSTKHPNKKMRSIKYSASWDG